LGLTAEIGSSAGVVVHRVGQTELVAAADLACFLRAVRARNLRVLGLEGFRIDGDSLVPDMDAIADFSSMAASAPSVDTVAEALLFLSEVGERKLHYELTLDEGDAK
jgi:hypothetical protein